MHRQDLLIKLASYRTRYPEEYSKVDSIVSFVLEYRNCFDCDNRHGHVTGSAWLLSRDMQRALLTHHRKLHKWLQLGGHAEGESIILNVALREAREESGICEIEPVSFEIFDIDVRLIPACKNEPEHKHYDIRFLLKTVNSDQFQCSDESHALRWLRASELGTLTDEESVLRMGRKWTALLGRPPDSFASGSKRPRPSNFQVSPPLNDC